MAMTSKARTFKGDEDGGTTAFALSLIMGGFMLGGLALDVAYSYKSRNELQIAADAAAHAALYIRQTETAAAAKTKAVDVANGTLPVSSFGNVLDPQDIQFGTWDFDAQTFSADANERDAVLVSTKRFASKGNAVRTFMLNFLGVETFDVRADSVFITHFPTCLRQGFAAQDEVDVQSNNTFYGGFCIHSNNLVSMGQNNDFEPGVIISMPDTQEVKSGSGNDGLQEALRDHSYKLRILDHMGDIWTSLMTGGGLLPAYITTTTPNAILANRITGTNSLALEVTDGDANLLAGQVYVIDCDGGKLDIAEDVVITDVVILTDCKLEFASGSAVENAILMTQNTDDHSVKSEAGFRIGRNDACAAGGGAQLLTFGGVGFPANLQIYGGQIIAKKDIKFAANASGAQGVSFIAGGKIDGTSNSDIRFCTTGMERNFEMPYFQLAG